MWQTCGYTSKLSYIALPCLPQSPLKSSFWIIRPISENTTIEKYKFLSTWVDLRLSDVPSPSITSSLVNISLKDTTYKQTQWQTHNLYWLSSLLVCIQFSSNAIYSQWWDRVQDVWMKCKILLPRSQNERQNTPSSFIQLFANCH